MRRMILFLALMPSLVLAQLQQSEDFQITKSVIDAGGAASASEDFKLYSAFGQPTPLGLQTSESFTLWAGYLSPIAEISPLSPIQALVIQEASPSVLLVWPPASGANAYKIYRDTTAVFTPSGLNYLTTVADTFFTDVNVVTLPPTKHFYIVQSSNEGLPAAQTAISTKSGTGEDSKRR